MKSKEVKVNGLILWVDYNEHFSISSVIISAVDDGTMNHPFKSVNVIHILEDDFITLIEKAITEQVAE